MFNEPIVFNYETSNSDLMRVKFVKDLGILLEQDISNNMKL